MGSVSSEPKSTCLIEKPARNNKTSHHSKATATRTPKEKERSGGGKASTPTMESTRPEPEAVDISAIGPSKLHYHNSFNSPTLDDTALSSRMRMGSTWSGSHASSKHGLQTFDMSSAFSHDSATDPSRTKARQTTQLQLDAHYARYLQWLFLRTSLTHSQHQQQRHCMNEAWTLWEETERGRARQTELEGQLTNIQHANRLDAALLLQVAGLSSVSEQLGELKRQYNHLAAALDTTRHQIPTKSVHIPKDEQHFQDRLSEALTETEGLLHELSTFTSARTPGVVRLSESLHVVHDAAHSQVVQLHRCYELLAAADSLNTRESSLRIQQLQAQVPLSSDKLYG